MILYHDHQDKDHCLINSLIEIGTEFFTQYEEMITNRKLNFDTGFDYEEEAQIKFKEIDSALTKLKDDIVKYLKDNKPE